MKGGDRNLRMRSQRGQSLVEVVLLTPVVLALLLGTIEMGRYAYLSILVGNAARAGAAYGAQSLPLSVDAIGIQTAADNDFQNNGPATGTLTISGGGPSGSYTSCGCDSGGTITAATCSPNVNPNAGICASGHWVVMVSVKAVGTFSSLFSFPGIPTSITVTQTATMRVPNN
jgi:Flp pilus assembly protein TadG